MRNLAVLLSAGFIAAFCSFAQATDEDFLYLTCVFEEQDAEMSMTTEIDSEGNFSRDLYFAREEFEWTLPLSQKPSAHNEVYRFIVNEGNPPHRWEVQIFRDGREGLAAIFTYLDLDPEDNTVHGRCMATPSKDIFD